MPATVLDLGIGYGKYGALLREFCSHNVERATVLTGVEGYRPYVTPMWTMYDAVKVEDFSNPIHWPDYVGFDLVLMIDSLEHLETTTAAKLLNHLTENNRFVIVSVPNGHCPQGSYKGNRLEEHRSTWYRYHLTEFGGHILADTDYALVAEFRGQIR